jgi:type I restriction enzyme, S subunit
MNAPTPLIDIRPDHWKIVRNILRKHVPQYEVWAFGSRATWKAKEFSDLDLAIITDQPLSLDVSASLNDDFSESDLPWKVDVVDWATTSASFRKIMERDKMVVQEGKARLDIANELSVLPLEDCLDALIDYRGKTPRKTNFGIPLITAKVVKSGRIETPDEFIAEEDYGTWMTRGYPEIGDVVLTTEAPLGEVAQIKFLPVALAQRIVTLRGKRNLLDSGYLLYLMQSQEMQAKLIGRSSGTTVMGIKQSELRKIEVSLPPIAEQRAIAHILGTLDDKIELNRKQNEVLDAMARTLFKAWFVDFEPVRAKMEGRWQRGQSLPGLPGHLYDVFPDRLVESELGEIPEGWELTSLSEFSSLNPESWTKRTRPEEILYVDLSNTKWGRVESVTKYQAADAPSRAQRVLRPQDTIVGTVRPGNGSYALISDEGLTGSTGFAVLRPLRRECSEFVYLAATARENIERLSNLADGGAYPAVRPEIVSATQVPRAGHELINEFSRQVSPMLAGIADNERTSSSLAQLRDTLLPKLVSGELRVPDAEAFLGEHGL